MVYVHSFEVHLQFEIAFLNIMQQSLIKDVNYAFLVPSKTEIMHNLHFFIILCGIIFSSNHLPVFSSQNCEWFLRFELKLYKPLMIEFRDVPLYASVRVILSQLNFSNCCNKLDNFRMLTFQKYPTLIMQHKHVKKLFQNVSIS